MTKTILVLLGYLLMSFSFLHANENKLFQTVKPSQATLVKNDSSKNFCNLCGMHLSKFYKTNHVTTFKNNNKEQYCSLHCQSTIIKSFKKMIKKVEVVDTNTLKLIDSKSAFYVINSSKKGTMSQISKYAFGNKIDAVKFQELFGGKIYNFKESIKIAQNDSIKDDLEINKKRSKMAKKGKKIYKAICKKDILPEFHSVGETKKYLLDKNICKKLKAKQLQAVSIYLYNPILAANKSKMIKVNKDSKCPVCGMFIGKYPKWVAQIEINKKDLHSFDGVKDMMKFYLNPSKYTHNHKQKDISKILVSDYYTLNAIDARKSFFVLGSNIYGPMGAELIPFKTKKEAEDFSKSHYGKRVLKFEEINENILF